MSYDLIDRYAERFRDAADRRADPRRRVVSAIAVAVVVGGLVTATIALVDPVPQREVPADIRPVSPPQTLKAVPAQCQGGRGPGQAPAYRVPHNAALTNVTLLGCARLPVSGKRIEFSGNVSRIGVGGPLVACINPAYNRGATVQGLCKAAPPFSRFGVRYGAPRGTIVEGYGLVVWGTQPSRRRVDVRFLGGVSRAAVLNVPRTAPELERLVDVPFSIFAAELPLSAACHPITVTASTNEATIPPRPRICHDG